MDACLWLTCRERLSCSSRARSSLRTIFSVSCWTTPRCQWYGWEIQQIAYRLCCCWQRWSPWCPCQTAHSTWIPLLRTMTAQVLRLYSTVRTSRLWTSLEWWVKGLGRRHATSNSSWRTPSGCRSCFHCSHARIRRVCLWGESVTCYAWT